MVRIEQAVVVEGRYDKIKLSRILDTLIIETNGFQIFKDKEKLALLRTLAEKRGLVILTDSDVAGFKIRRYLMSAVGKARITNVYIPDILGKEKRKQAPSKEGKLGVEGMEDRLLLNILEKAGVLATEESMAKEPITKLHLYEDGLSGGPDSGEKRRRLIRELDLPEYLSANSLVDILNVLMTLPEYRALIDRLFSSRS